MDIELLKDQLDFVQARIEEIEKLVINANPNDKGYKEQIESYNKWIDRYNEILNEIEHFDDVDIDAEKLKQEARKLDLEHDRMIIQEQLEQDKINLGTEQLRLDREKFAYDVDQAKKQEVIDIIFKVGDLVVKLVPPTLGIAAGIYVANLSYMNDSKLEMCNGRVAGTFKDIYKVLTMKQV